MSAEYEKKGTLASCSADALKAVLESHPYPFSAVLTTRSDDNAWVATISVYVQEANNNETKP
jgi:hypothetical protein